MGFRVYDKARDLPDCWDSFSNEVFLQKQYLAFLEKVNPCNQKYHLNKQEGILLVTYQLKLDIFTYKNSFALRLPIRIAGLPLSVAYPGYFCPKGKEKMLSQYLGAMPLVLVLNTVGELDLPCGATLPTFQLGLEQSWENFLDKKTSRHRYRLKKALKRGRGLLFEPLDKAQFGPEHYRFYEEVYANSEGKLEKLSLEFFRTSPWELVQVLDSNKEVMGFFQWMKLKTTQNTDQLKTPKYREVIWNRDKEENQKVANQGDKILGNKPDDNPLDHEIDPKQLNNELVFLFCGFDHTKNKEYDLYLNILLYAAKLGIELGCNQLHLGQTTAFSKTRLGAEEKQLYLHIGSKWIPSSLLKRLAKTLGRKK